MHRLLTLLALAAASPLALAEDRAPTAMLRGANGPVLEVLGQKGESLARFASPGWSLALSQGNPSMYQLSATQVLVEWSGPAGTALSIVESRGGALRETWSDVFEPGWSIQPAGDFNKDGLPDFLVIGSKGEGDSRSFSCTVALFDKASGLDLVTEPVQVVATCRGAYFASGDMDGDGAADLVYHSFDYGGSYETQLFMLKGHGDGTFDAEPKKQEILHSPFAASAPVLVDLDGDGDLDVFLPPDDDVADEGQSHVAFNDGKGRMADLKESIDFSANEGDNPDNFIAYASTADTDGDGRIDLVAACTVIPEGAYEIRVHKGVAKGGFADEATVIASGKYAETPAPALGWINWNAKDGQGPDAQPPSQEDLEASWKSLGSAKPREALAAMRSFLKAGAAAAPFLVAHVPAASPFDEKRVAALIHDLDDDDYKVRDRATEALSGLADVAGPMIRKALADKPSAEAKMRLEQALNSGAEGKTADVPPSEATSLRLLALLEAIGTPECLEAIPRVGQAEGSAGLRKAVRETAGRVKK